MFQRLRLTLPDEAQEGKVVDRDLFFDHCWGMDDIPSSCALDQHISQLRKRIEADPHDPKIIRTVYGVGYWCEESCLFSQKKT